MKTICKYNFHEVGLVNLKLPQGYEVLSFQAQHGKLCAWILIECGQPLIQSDFYIASTGGHFDQANYKYVATAQLGNEVWHLFDLLTQELARMKRIDDFTEGWTLNSIEEDSNY